MARVTARRKMVRITADGQIQRPDTLTVEEPLELRVDGRSLAVTMRTPGSDIDLAHGFLLSENIIGSAEDVVSARYCAGTDADGQNTYNVLDIQLRTPAPISVRNFLTSSSCGLCGKAALDEVRTSSRFPPPAGGPLLDPAVLAALPEQLRSRQAVFEATGGLHAAGLCTADGTLLAVREDIGRHNAVDKVIGWALREGRVPAHDLILVVSSRASFELVQKAVMAGIPALCAVSAASSLAVDLAVESGLTLAAFVRDGSMNVYSGLDRIARRATDAAPRPDSATRPAPEAPAAGPMSRIRIPLNATTGPRLPDVLLRSALEHVSIHREWSWVHRRFARRSNGTSNWWAAVRPPRSPNSTHPTPPWRIRSAPIPGTDSTRSASSTA